MKTFSNQPSVNSAPAESPIRTAGKIFFVAVLVGCAIGAASVTGRAAAPYKAVTGPCQLQFPADHGAHPGYRTEWWYYTGNLSARTGETFGFQLTFFRSQLSPPGADQNWPEKPSPWRTQQLFLAHAAVADITHNNFHHAEKISRGVPKLAGVSEDQHGVTVFLHNWSARIEQDQHQLAADSDPFSFRFTLHPQKPPVAHGDSGYSRKGRLAESASCYYSLTRLAVSGELLLNGRRFEVTGLAWMDHEFSSAPLESNLVGWDWFSLQMDDETDLMIYLLRQQDGSYSPASSGTVVKADGQALHLVSEMFSVEVLNKWKSPASGAIYPAKWRLLVPQLEIDLTIQPNLANQEMRTPESTQVTYWEGSVSARGFHQGTPWTGAGYVELTGYDKTFDAPM